MSTDYTPAIIGLVALIVLLTGMVGFILSRPSDLTSTPR
jgi:hypothetical protein